MLPFSGFGAPCHQISQNHPVGERSGFADSDGDSRREEKAYDKELSEKDFRDENFWLVSETEVFFIHIGRNEHTEYRLTSALCEIIIAYLFMKFNIL